MASPGPNCRQGLSPSRVFVGRGGVGGARGRVQEIYGCPLVVLDATTSSPGMNTKLLCSEHTHKGICLQMAVAPINTKSFREKCELAFPTGLTVSFVSFLSFIPLDRFFFLYECSGMGERKRVRVTEIWGKSISRKLFADTKSVLSKA